MRKGGRGERRRERNEEGEALGLGLGLGLGFWEGIGEGRKRRGLKWESGVRSAMFATGTVRRGRGGINSREFRPTCSDSSSEFVAGVWFRVGSCKTRIKFESGN